MENISRIHTAFISSSSTRLLLSPTIFLQTPFQLPTTTNTDMYVFSFDFFFFLKFRPHRLLNIATNLSDQRLSLSHTKKRLMIYDSHILEQLEN